MQRRAKNVQKRAANVDLIKKRASQGFLDPIQNRALSRSVQLKAVYLEALLYLETKMKEVKGLSNTSMAGSLLKYFLFLQHIKWTFVVHNSKSTLFYWPYEH